MKPKTRQRSCVPAWLVLCLWAGGCSGENPQPLPVARMTSTPPVEPSLDERPVTPVEPALAEVAPLVEEQVPPHVAAEVTESPEQTPENALAWDTLEQRRVVNADDGPVPFSFRMTNRSPDAITVEKINTSCGCTTADTRPLPFTVAPGASESVQIRMSVTGKFGTVTKSVLVQTSCGTSTLLVTSQVTPAKDEVFVEGLPNGAVMSSGLRGKNISLAKADRQAVFKGGCAECHSQYAQQQFGYNLYLGACAICHDAKHRASMVPDLRAAGVPRDAAHWREHITDGIDDTLMPAFAKGQGGILSDEQIESLVKFLVETPLAPKALHR